MVTAVSGRQSEERTVIDPVRRGGERNAFAARGKREDLAGEDPPDRAVAHPVRGGERVHAPDRDPCGEGVRRPFGAVAVDEDGDEQVRERHRRAAPAEERAPTEAVDEGDRGQDGEELHDADAPSGHEGH